MEATVTPHMEHKGFNVSSLWLTCGILAQGRLVLSREVTPGVSADPAPAPVIRPLHAPPSTVSVWHNITSTELSSAVKRSISFTIGFHNHGEGPYKGLLLVESAY